MLGVKLNQSLNFLSVEEEEIDDELESFFMNTKQKGEDGKNFC